MRLNELEDFNTEHFAMVKFTSKEWVNSFLDGDIYMNNFKHFIDQEKTSKIKGQGDAYEGAHVLEFSNAKLYDKNNNLIATAKFANLIERYIDVNKLPMFCVANFSAKDFVVLEHAEDYIIVKLVIPSEDIEKIKETFKADTVAVTLMPHHFMKRFSNVAEESNLGLSCGMVEYADYKILDTERKKSFDEGNVDFLFTKHNSLSYQKEFRFILTNVKSEEPYTLKLGDLRDLFIELDADAFLNGITLRINFKKNNI